LTVNVSKLTVNAASHQLHLCMSSEFNIHFWEWNWVHFIYIFTLFSNISVEGN